MSWQSHCPLWESFFPALFIPSDIPARNSPVYITALVGWSILLSTALHSHHSLFNMEQAQIWSILENAQEAWCAAKKSGGVWIKMKQCRREQEQGLVVSRDQSKQKERGVFFLVGGAGRENVLVQECGTAVSTVWKHAIQETGFPGGAGGKEPDCQCWQT